MSLSEIEKKIEGKEIKSVEDARKYLTDEEILYYMETISFGASVRALKMRTYALWLKSSAFWAARDIALRIRPGFFRRVKRLLKESRSLGFSKSRSDAFELLTGGETIETIQKKTAKAVQHTLLYRQSD